MFILFRDMKHSVLWFFCFLRLSVTSKFIYQRIEYLKTILNRDTNKLSKKGAVHTIVRQLLLK